MLDGLACGPECVMEQLRVLFETHGLPIVAVQFTDTWMVVRVASIG